MISKDSEANKTTVSISTRYGQLVARGSGRATVVFVFRVGRAAARPAGGRARRRAGGPLAIRHPKAEATPTHTRGARPAFNSQVTPGPQSVPIHRDKPAGIAGPRSFQRVVGRSAHGIGAARIGGFGQGQCPCLAHAPMVKRGHKANGGPRSSCVRI